MKKEPTCPCCKYQPKRNASGVVRKGYNEFEEVGVSHDHMDYDSTRTHIGWACPECGVIFKVK